MKTPLALALLAGVCLAAAARPDDDKEPVFVVRTADGKSARGPLRRLGPDWAVDLGAATLPGADVLTVRRALAPLPPPPLDLCLLLANGDRIPVEDSLRLDGDKIRFRHPYLADAKETSLPLSAVSVVWFSETAAEHPERLRRRLVSEKRKNDVVLLRNGDALEGVLTALTWTRDDKTIEIDPGKKPVTVEGSRTAAVALSSELTQPLRPEGVYGRVVLSSPGAADGTRLSLSSASCKDGATLTGVTLFGATLSVPLERVAALDLLGGKATYLSDLKPSRYEYLPYLDDRWDYAANGSTTGLSLRLAGSVYDRGVGLHSHGRLSYAVPKDCRRFEAVVGVDDRAGPRGAARVRLLADGKALDLGADRELTAGGEPLAVGVDVTGVKELTLEVDYGKRGPVEGHVDWVDARFVK